MSHPVPLTLPLLRCLNQQILTPQFDKPETLVDWMGAVQAQQFAAAKWALGLRLKGTSTVQQIDDALCNGQLVRTHVMRPTWHFVAGKNIRWLLALSKEGNKRQSNGYLKSGGVVISPEDYVKSLLCVEKALQGHKSLTAQELAPYFTQAGLPFSEIHLKGYIWNAEYEGLICNGRVEGTQITYSLLEEQVNPAPTPSKEEALVQLAHCYFRSHSPATQKDFLSWSGLKVSEVKIAIKGLESHLQTETIDGTTWYIHDQSRTKGNLSQAFNLLPPFDEYLIGYADRTHVLPKAFYPKAFTNYGIFYPVIQYQGQVIGNWEATKKTKGFQWKYTYFRESPAPEELVIPVQQQYAAFMASPGA